MSDGRGATVAEISKTREPDLYFDGADKLRARMQEEEQASALAVEVCTSEEPQQAQL